MFDAHRGKAIFLEAVEQHSPDQWSTFLAKECGDDRILHAHIESLLQAHLVPNPVLDEIDPSLTLGDTQIAIVGQVAASETFPSISISHFKIERMIGRGGMGNVFLAHDEVLDRPVAIKLPRIDVLGNAKLQKRFLKEAKVAASLRHPGLVEIYEYGASGRYCFLASRWCAGGDLAAWLEQHPIPGDQRSIADFIRKLCCAIDHCHQAGVLHLDIKPGNILLDRHPTSSPQDSIDLGEPLLTDFGLARVIEQSLSDAQSSMLLGTPLYMAPEQAECRGDDIGPHTDVFAIGIVLFEMLYGRRPFQGETPIEVFDQIRAGKINFDDAPSTLADGLALADDLKTICRICLQTRIADRYPSAQALADDLGRFLDRKPIFATTPTLARRMGHWLSDQKRIRQAGLILLGIQVHGTLSIFLLFGLMLVGLASPFESSPWRLAIDYAPLFVVINIPSFLVGFKAIAMRPWAITAGLLLSCLYSIAVILMAMGKMEPLGVYDGFPAAEFMGSYIHSIFAAVQLAAFVVAIPAAIRHDSAP